MKKTYWLGVLLLTLALVFSSAVFPVYADETTDTDSSASEATEEITTEVVTDTDSAASEDTEETSTEAFTDTDSAASEDAEEEDDFAFEEEKVGKPRLFWDIISPRLSYNPVENWRFGLRFKNTFADTHTVRAYSEYSYTAKSFDHGLGYFYVLNTDQSSFNIYTSYEDIIKSQGLFNDSLLWQQNKIARLGVTNKLVTYDEMYNAMRYIDLKVEYHERTPKTNVSLPFDAGRDLVINPSIMGFYKGFTGNLDLVYGVPTSISDYNYIRVNAMLKQRFDLNENNRFYLSAGGGIISGQHPYERNFFLGSSSSNFVPNFMTKLRGGFGEQGFKTVVAPKVSLDGFRDNSFVGDKMAIAKLEYQCRPKSIEGITLPWLKVYGIAGDAWSGEFNQINLKSAIGAGITFDILGGLDNEGSYWGMNMAKGFGDNSAFTIGFEYGMLFNYTLSEPQI